MAAIVVSRESAREHGITAATMLAVEAAALNLLRQVVQGATAGNRPVVAAKALQAPAARAIAQVHAAARRAGAARLSAELDALAPELASVGAPRVDVPRLTPPVDVDQIRAERAAAGLAAVYLREAEKAAKEADRPRALWGSAGVQSRLELDAATEVSVTFSDERERIERALRERNRDARWLPFIGRQWNAVNDKRRCPRCAERDGKIRPLGSDFGGESPGSIHPFCRCFAALIFAPIYLGREEVQEVA